MNIEFLPVLPVCVLGIVMTIWGEKIAKKHPQLVKGIYTVCGWGSMGGLVFAAISLVLALIFSGSIVVECLAGKVAPVIFATGFAMLAVRFSIYHRCGLPEEMLEGKKQTKEG